MKRPKGRFVSDQVLSKYRSNIIFCLHIMCLIQWNFKICNSLMWHHLVPRVSTNNKIFLFPPECIKSAFKKYHETNLRYPKCTTPWTQSELGLTNYTETVACNLSQSKTEIGLNMEFINLAFHREVGCKGSSHWSNIVIQMLNFFWCECV